MIAFSLALKKVYKMAVEKKLVITGKNGNKVTFVYENGIIRVSTDENGAIINPNGLACKPFWFIYLEVFSGGGWCRHWCRYHACVSATLHKPPCVACIGFQATQNHFVGLLGMVPG